MRPHEEEWTWKRTNLGPIVEAGDASVCMVYAPGPESGVRTLAASDEAQRKRADLIAAAPAMARALLAHGRFGVEANGEFPVWHTQTCWERNLAVCTQQCQRDRDVLVGAGVLP